MNPVHNIESMKPFSMVVLYFGYNRLRLVCLQPNGYSDTTRGRFLHDTFFGRPFGTKVFSQNDKGFGFALRPDPHLFSLTLQHKTQILFQADISMILHLLALSPGNVVFESGTGSCSLTCSLSKRVAASGQVFTFEFNQERFQNALKVTREMKLTNVRCHWQNVLENGFVISEFLGDCEEEQRRLIHQNERIVSLNELPQIRFDRIADAVFLDLPSPELVVPHADKVLKRGGRLCSFSPCIEQIQETAKAMAEFNYSEIRTVEIIEREMKSKWIGNISLEEEKGKANRDKMGLFVDQNDQKMHTGYLIFATMF